MGKGLAQLLLEIRDIVLKEMGLPSSALQSKMGPSSAACVI